MNKAMAETEKLLSITTKNITKIQGNTRNALLIKLYKSEDAFKFTLNNVTTSEPKLQTKNYLKLVWNPKPDFFYLIKEYLTIFICTFFCFYDTSLCIKKCYPATLRGQQRTWSFTLWIGYLQSQRVTVRELGRSP